MLVCKFELVDYYGGLLWILLFRHDRPQYSGALIYFFFNSDTSFLPEDFHLQSAKLQV